MKNKFCPVILLILTATLFSAIAIFNPNKQAHAEQAHLEWQLTVTGLVEHSLNLSLTELSAMPKATVNAALICVGLPDIPLAEGNWVGVKLSSLLEAAGVTSNAVKIAFHASDGYSTDLPIETARREDVIIAYEKDSVPLSETLRLIVPGKWGYKWISQLVSIEVVDYDFLGYWESRGYPDDAEIAEGTVPEFSFILAFITPLIIAGLFALVLKNKLRRTFKA
ncbi:MAG: molybdopterin-dependent oxidoreductase [Candidatus Bathyarchaeia archaeon]